MTGDAHPQPALRFGLPPRGRSTVAPGPVQTDMLERFTGGNADAKAGLLAMMRAKRGATTDEIAQTILFLASDKAKYLTGQSIAVDGGYTAQ